MAKPILGPSGPHVTDPKIKEMRDTLSERMPEPDRNL
jgi:hypothetical protein